MITTPVQRSLEAFDADFRIRAHRIGLLSSAFGCLYMAAYVAITWDQPDRLALTALLAGGALVTVAMLVVPLTRVIGGPSREPLLIAWSLCLVALIIAAAAVDGGASSPVTLLLFVVPVYAALAYPLRATLIVGTVNVLAYVALATITGGLPFGTALVVAAALVHVTGIGAGQGRNHERQRRELERSARIDPLTGVLNRLGFEERLAAEVNRGRRHRGPLGLAIVDLDRFKAVNDSQGHPAGDQLLCTIAGALRAGVRAEDAVGRLGGDEFGVILASGDPRTAARRIEQMLDAIAPATLGLAVFPEDGEDELSLQRAADSELYANKRRNRERTV